MKGAQMAGGLALGAATGGAALAARGNPFVELALGDGKLAVDKEGAGKRRAGWGGGMARSVF